MWVSPFGHPRISGYVLLPAAFRSLSRPSSAPSAKAFALCSSSVDLIGIALTIPPAVPCTSVYMVCCLSASSRAAMCGLFSCLYQTSLNFMIDPHFPFRFRLNHILDSFPICCLRILHRDCLPVYVMSSCPLRVQEAHASRGMWLRLFRPVRKRPAVSAVSTHHFEDTCVCSFQGTSMPSCFCFRPLPS